MFGIGKTADLEMKLERCKEAADEWQELARHREKKINELEENHERRVERLEELQDQEINDLVWEHTLALKKKAYEIEDLPVVKEIRAENERLTRKVEVMQKELQMTEKVVDLNADIIEIKDLFNTLITKLPEVKISSLAVSNNGNCK